MPLPHSVLLRLYFISILMSSLSLAQGNRNGILTTPHCCIFFLFILLQHGSSKGHSFYQKTCVGEGFPQVPSLRACPLALAEGSPQAADGYCRWISATSQNSLVCLTWSSPGAAQKSLLQEQRFLWCVHMCLEHLLSFLQWPWCLQGSLSPFFFFFFFLLTPLPLSQLLWNVFISFKYAFPQVPSVCLRAQLCGAVGLTELSALAGRLWLQPLLTEAGPADLSFQHTSKDTPCTILLVLN